MRLSNGWLVGITSGGGTSGQGTVFFVDTMTSTFYSYAFQKTEGKTPIGGFNIFFYRATVSGGANGEGNVYRLGAHGLVNKHSFASNRQAGYAPMGDWDFSTVCKLSPELNKQWKFTVV